jgi:hypothetical protein
VKLFDGLEFKYDGIFHHNIEPVSAFYLDTSIRYRQHKLALIPNLPMIQFMA